MNPVNISWKLCIFHENSASVYESDEYFMKIVHISFKSVKYSQIYSTLKITKNLETQSSAVFRWFTTLGTWTVGTTSEMSLTLTQIFSAGNARNRSNPNLNRFYASRAFIWNRFHINPSRIREATALWKSPKTTKITIFAFLDVLTPKSSF